MPAFDTDRLKGFGSGPGTLTGVVLAGGLSSRMGHDKASIRPAHDKPEDLLSRAAALLANCCDNVLVVGREHPVYHSCLDQVPGNGPVGGITTALDTSGTACLVLSCDLPFISAKELNALIAQRESRTEAMLSTAYRQIDTGYIEALVAIYEYQSLPYFQRCLTEKKLKVSRIVPQERQQFLDYRAEDSLPFFNINYPADLAVAKLLMGTR